MDRFGTDWVLMSEPAVNGARHPRSRPTGLRSCHERGRTGPQSVGLIATVGAGRDTVRVTDELRALEGLRDAALALLAADADPARTDDTLAGLRGAAADAYPPTSGVRPAEPR